MIFWNLGCDYQVDLLMKGSDQKMVKESVKKSVGPDELLRFYNIETT